MCIRDSIWCNPDHTTKLLECHLQWTNLVQSWAHHKTKRESFAGYTLDTILSSLKIPRECHLPDTYLIQPWAQHTYTLGAPFSGLAFNTTPNIPDMLRAGHLQDTNWIQPWTPHMLRRGDYLQGMNWMQSWTARLQNTKRGPCAGYKLGR